MQDDCASTIHIRLATFADIPLVNSIAARSVRALHRGFEDAAIVDKAVREVYGVDWQLVRDQTYFVAEIDQTVAGAGGWSFRETIGGAHGPDVNPSRCLDPITEPARIRAFYVDPSYAGRGVARSILDEGEQAARDYGFSRSRLTATLASVTAWTALGYSIEGDYTMPLRGGGNLCQKVMSKNLLGDKCDIIL